MSDTNRLSHRLTRLCMLGAVALGIVLSLIQISVDAVRESGRINQRMDSTLSVVRDSAAEAVYNIDDHLARRIVTGLTLSEGVLLARLALTDRVLAESQVTIAPRRLRGLTDVLFDARREYVLPLNHPATSEVLGQLTVVLDTSIAGRDFLVRSGLIVVSGLVRAVLLASVLLGVFYLLLTRPFGALKQALERVDPEAPERVQLPIPPGHERDELGRWAEAVNQLLVTIRRNLEARAEAEDQALFHRQFDSLTQLPGRALFDDRVRQSLERAAHAGESPALMLLDISGFHAVNDQYGYAVGDRFLISIAERIQSMLPPGDHAARISGDRFAVLHGAGGDEGSILQFAERLRLRIQTPIPIGERAAGPDIRIGISLYPADGTVAESLLKNAENALALARQPGHSGIQFYEQRTGEEIRARNRLRHAIEAATSNDELQLHYQPVFSATGGHLAGVEALLRWPRAAADNVSTETLIRVAEESGHIIALGEWVLRRACRDAAGWRAQGIRVPRLAINISAVQLCHEGFVHSLGRILDDSGVEPTSLELEVTETAMMNDVDSVIRQLETLRARGLHVAIDDFGTGHSSLQYLKRLPVTALKIDRSFVRDVGIDAGDAQIVKAILSLGKSLNKRIVAEGVEDERQLRFLQAHGCDDLQGYLLGRPMPAADLAVLAADHAAVQAMILAQGGAGAA